MRIKSREVTLAGSSIQRIPKEFRNCIFRRTSLAACVLTDKSNAENRNLFVRFRANQRFDFIFGGACHGIYKSVQILRLDGFVLR